MTAIDVLARALYEQSGGFKNQPYDALTDALRDNWILQAEVIAGRMIEAEGGAPEKEQHLTDDPVGVFLAAAVNVNETVTVDNLDWETAVRLLAQLRDGIEQARYVEANLTRHIYLTGEHGDRELDGLGVVKILRGRDRKSWDGRGVAQAVLDAQMTKRSGELPDDPWEVIEWFLEVFPADRPRVTPLRALGIDPDQFCESAPGKPTVQFPSRG